MLGMHAMHIKMAKPAVPQYWVALGNEGNLGANIRWGTRRGSWGQLWLVGQEVEAVAIWFQHTHSCGHHDQSSISVGRKMNSQPLCACIQLTPSMRPMC
jgi:hypothetical protein